MQKETKIFHSSLKMTKLTLSSLTKLKLKIRMKKMFKIKLLLFNMQTSLKRAKLGCLKTFLNLTATIQIKKKRLTERSQKEKVWLATAVKILIAKILNTSKNEQK